MTVIYANRGDLDTLLLPMMWYSLEGVNVVEVNRDTENYESLVDEAISNEDGTLILCGHGTNQGLLHPIIERGEYLIHENNYKLIQARNVIGVWCHASEFAEKMRMNGFFTSMYVSNINEAYYYGLYEASQEQISKGLGMFCSRINTLLDQNVPLNEWVESLNNRLDENNIVDKYNYNGFRYFNFE